MRSIRGDTSAAPRPRGSGRRLALGLVLVLAACRTAAPRIDGLEPPPLVPTVRCFAGSPLTGPLGPARRTVDLTPARALLARVEFIGLERVPDTVLEPLAERTRLLTAAGIGVPLLPMSQTLAGARFALGERADRFRSRLLGWGDFGRTSPIAVLDAALPIGVTAVFRVEGRFSTGVRPSGGSYRPRLTVMVHRAPTAGAGEVAPFSIGLEMVESEAPDPAREEAASEDEDPPVHREGVMLDVRLPVGETLALLLPTPIRERRPRGVAAFLRVEDASDSESYPRALARCREELERSGGQATPAGTADATARSGLATVVEALDWRANRRKALLTLANSGGARLATEAALLLDDALVDRIADAVQRGFAPWIAGDPPGEAPDAADIGWRLDQTVGRVLAEASREKASSPELAGLLVRFTGEAGRRPEMLAGVLSDAVSLEDLERRLIELNRIFLEDPAPSARIRAHDWLARRGRAPEGYDPLEPSEKRRAALDRASEAESAGSGAAGGRNR